MANMLGFLLFVIRHYVNKADLSTKKEEARTGARISCAHVFKNGHAGIATPAGKGQTPTYGVGYGACRKPFER